MARLPEKRCRVNEHPHARAAERGASLAISQIVVQADVGDALVPQELDHLGRKSNLEPSPAAQAFHHQVDFHDSPSVPPTPPMPLLLGESAGVPLLVQGPALRARCEWLPDRSLAGALARSRDLAAACIASPSSRPAHYSSSQLAVVGVAHACFRCSPMTSMRPTILSFNSSSSSAGIHHSVW